MQVKSRINRFFGNILRKENVEAEEPHQSELPKLKKKSNKKNNQSYSQWDLMDHIAVDTGKESPIMCDEKAIFSDGLTLDSLDMCNKEYYQEPVLDTVPKRKSFLKRSSSLLRRSMKRSKTKGVANQSPETRIISPGSVANIVQQINETLMEVAGFSGEVSESSAQIVQSKPLVETSFQKDSNDQFFEEWYHEQGVFLEEKKPGLTNGLKRKASKLVSKFQRTSGSMRLKSANSVESFPKSTVTQQRSASFTSIKGENEPDVIMKRGGSLRRKLSFKKAKKVMVKGASSFGKSMVHASAVMPVAYECPPVSYYPDYDPDSPTELEHYYYRTISYQQREPTSSNQTGKYSQYARPTAFYQHGYCYNC